MPTECSATEIGFWKGRRTPGGGGFRRRGDHLGRRGAAAGRGGSGHRADPIGLPRALPTTAIPIVEHSVYDLLAQRVYGLALGYEDLNDHDTASRSVAGVLVGKARPARRSDRGKSLAGKSTLNRLELTPGRAREPLQKGGRSAPQIEAFFVEMFLDVQPKPPEEIVLDLDATDDPIHGHQLGRFFHGYYDSYCYLPLYIFCGEFLLAAKLRPSDIDGAAARWRRWRASSGRSARAGRG